MKTFKAIALLLLVLASGLLAACGSGAVTRTTATTPAVIPPRPAEFKVTKLTAPTGPVHAGVTAAITVEVTNSGEVSGSYGLILKSNGVGMASQEVVLSGGETKTVTFEVSRPKQGTYKLEAGELSADFQVTPLPMSEATLRLSDLPTGFSSFNIFDFGIDTTILARDFSEKASASDVFAFLKLTDPGSAVAVFGFNIYPLSETEQINADTELAAGMDGLAGGIGFAGSPVDSIILLPQFNNIGDKAAGLRFVFTEGETQLTADVVIFRNGETITIFFTMGTEGPTTEVSTFDLVSLLQSRIDIVEASR